MIAIALKYYREIAMAIVILCSLYLLWSKDQKIESLEHDISMLMMENALLESKLKQKQDQLAAQNILMLANKTEYEENMKRLPMRIDTIKTKYVAVYKEIDDYKGEANASDCNGAMDQLNRFTF